MLLQRLPGLGRTSAATEDRQFVDTYLLDGLRASHVLDLLEVADPAVLSADWINPLNDAGLLILGRKIAVFGLVEDAIGFCRKNTRERNSTLLFDIVSALVASAGQPIDLSGIEIVSGHSVTLDLSQSIVKNLYVGDSAIERLVIGGADPVGTRIERTTIGKLEGVANERGIPVWLQNNNKFSSYTSIATVSRIRNANISAGHKVLVTILRKTYFQKGAARKEEALLRGLGKLVKSGQVDRIINKLVAEGLINIVTGDSGKLYAPVRANTARVGKMLAELNMSADPVWRFVGELGD